MVRIHVVVAVILFLSTQVLSASLHDEEVQEAKGDLIMEENKVLDIDDILFLHKSKDLLPLLEMSHVQKSPRMLRQIWSEVNHEDLKEKPTVIDSNSPIIPLIDNASSAEGSVITSIAIPEAPVPLRVEYNPAERPPRPVGPYEHLIDKRVSRQMHEQPYYPFQHMGYPPVYYDTFLSNSYKDVLPPSEISYVPGSPAPDISYVPEAPTVLPSESWSETNQEASTGAPPMIDSNSPIIPPTDNTPIAEGSVITSTATPESPVPPRVEYNPPLRPPRPVGPRGLLRYCKEARGQFALPTSCQSFVNCWDGFAKEQRCQSGLYYSEAINGCDFPYRVQCKVAIAQKEDEIRSCKYNGDFYRNPNNCSEFYLCDRSNPILIACPDDLVFNQKIGVCDYGWNVRDCPNPSLKQINRSFYSRNLGVIDTDIKCAPGSIVKLSQNCSEVSVCSSDGLSKIIKCPQHMAYDVINQKCMSEHLSKC